MRRQLKGSKLTEHAPVGKATCNAPQGANAAFTKAALVAPPVTFTDATAPAVAGLTPRQLRDFVRQHAVPYCKAGRRLVVRVDRFLEAIDRLSGGKPLRPWSEADLLAQIAAGSRGGAR